MTAEAISAGTRAVPVEPTGDLRADIRAAVQAAVDSYVRSPVGAALPGVVADLVQDPEGAELLDALLHPHRVALQQIVRDAAARGELPDDTDAELLHELVAGTLLYRLLRRRALDGLTDELTGLLLDGLSATRRAAR